MPECGMRSAECGAGTGNDWFELCLDKYPDLPSVAVIRSLELKHFPREYFEDPVLDLCCGDGFFANSLGLRGIYGCDLDPEAVKKADLLRPTYHRAVTCDARTLDTFRDSQFKTVFSNCALEHVDGIDRAVTNISRVLMPGGRLIMSVPGTNLNEWFWPKAMAARLGLRDYGQYLSEEYNRKQQHINIWSREAWAQKLAEAGLRTEKTFFLFTEQDYRLITFFESFVLDSFPGGLLRRGYSLYRRVMPLPLRKSLWRRLLKPVYIRSAEMDAGAELYIIARKK